MFSPVNIVAVEKMVRSWPKRAAVRGSAYFDRSLVRDASRPDYPIEIVPFRDHPRFQRATPEQQQAVLTWGWLVYNERVIVAEERVANPALAMVMHGVFPGATDLALRQAVQQTVIDEQFHTYMHMTAIEETRAFRRTEGELGAPCSITFRTLLEYQARAAERWEKDLLTLCFAIVAEISVNAYLTLLSENERIEPLNRLVPFLHNRDEFAHGSLFVEVGKAVYQNMDAGKRRSFVAALPVALRAFAAHDFSAWKAILMRVGLAGADEIIRDCEGDTSVKTLVRDFSGLRDLAEQIGISNDLDFEFPARAA